MEQFFTNHYQEFSALGHVLLAMCLGAIVGIEREAAKKPAGLRTHTLVAGAAALIVSLGDVLINKFAADSGHHLVNTDPIRLVEAIVTGISFLCAGTIFKAKNEDTVEGLTTAASILLSSAIGMCVALQQLVLACGSVLLAIIVLRLMERLSYGIREN